MADVYKSDPANAQYAALYANMLLEGGQMDAAKAVIEKIPDNALDMNTLHATGSEWNEIAPLLEEAMLALSEVLSGKPPSFSRN